MDKDFLQEDQYQSKKGMEFKQVPSMEGRYQNPVVSFFQKTFHFLKNLAVRFLNWLRFPVPRWRPIVAMLLLFSIVWGILLYQSSPGYAASYTFVQSSWSGGSSANTTSHPSGQTGWNKYSTATNISASTTVGTATYSLTKNENFSTTDTTADKDSGNTTANWVASTAIGVPLAQNFLAYWKFDESSAGTFADSTGNSNTLTGFGASGSNNTPQPSSTVPSGIGFTNTHSLNFDGTDDYAKTTSTATLTGTVTVTAWIRISSLAGISGGNGATIMRSGSSTTSLNNFDMSILNSAGSAKLRWGWANNTAMAVGATTLALNTWYHVAAVRSGSAGNWSVAVYVNGVSDATNTQTTDPTGGTYPYYVGNNTSAFFFPGLIDDARVYDRVLSGSEISSLAAGNDLAGGAVVAQSVNVNSGSDNIQTVTLTKSDTPGIGTIAYYVSNDGGSTFNQVTAGQQYTFSALHNDLRWKITVTSNATVSSISLVYTGYYASADLTSSAYDTGDSGNLVAKIAWASSGESGSEVLKLQIRTSPDGSTWSGWCGASDTGSSCGGSNYFTSSDNNVTIASSNPVRSGGNDRWFEYKITLLSGGGATATLSNVTMTYVVNAPPEFNSSNGLTVSQITDSSDSNYGKVKIIYSIRDPDTSTGTTNPGFIVPSFEYNIGSGYVSITSGYLSANATDLKAVDGSTYTQYTAYWNAQSQIANNYLTTAKVRVTINDNEAANNTAQSASSNFILDTRVPVISAYTLDVTQSQLTLHASDDTNLQYRLSNNADLSADGLNTTSGEWQTAGGTSISLTPSWNFAAVPNHSTVYLQVRDVAGNVSSSTGVAPSAPSNSYIRDISDPSKSNFSMFTSWSVYTSVAGATFSKYEVYRSTDGASYSLLASITERAVNYYGDFDLTQDQTYYYKVRTVDSDNDIGGYSDVVSQAAHGGGGGTNNVAPVISNVVVSETQSTYATITWTTDTLSDSRADYSISPNNSFNLAGQSVASFVFDHSVTLTNLTPNTTYLFRVSSIDAFNNTGTDDNDGAGFSFTTSGGPLITNVTETAVNGNSADIVWNTDTNSDSYVTYSTNSDLSSSSRVGSSSLVGGTGPVYVHNISLTGLSAGTQYYYFVESTDGSHNYSKDNNGGSFYNFVTPVDNNPPVISSIEVPVTSLTAAVVVWRTDKPATTQLSYGTTAGTYDTTTTIDSTLTIFHVVALNGLTASTKYYYVVKSRSAADVEAISEENDFTTNESAVVVGGGGSSGSGTQQDSTPPTITNIKIQNVTSFRADISYSTNEDTVGIIQYGDDPAVLSQSAGDVTYSTSHKISLSGLITGTKYTFKIVAIDKSGNITTSDAQDFTTKFFTESLINISEAYAFQKQVDDAIESALPSLVAPFIEKPEVTNITESGATVVWRTNVKAYSAVAYAAESEYDVTKDSPYATEISDTTNKVTSHSLDLTGLTPNTRYHIAVKAFTLPQLQNRTDDITFVTSAPKIQAHISEVKNSSFRAVWTSQTPTTSVVEYRNTKTGQTDQTTLDEKIIDHNVLVEHLIPGTTYEVNIFGINDKGNKVSIASAIKVVLSVDTTGPQITELKISSALLPGTTDRAQTIISWKTDEPASSAILYKDGTAKPDEKLPNKVETKNDFVTDHAVVVSSLKPGGLYSIQVDSVDIAGNETLMPIRTIVVPRQAESVLDMIFKNFEDTFQFLKNIKK